MFYDGDIYKHRLKTFTLYVFTFSVLLSDLTYSICRNYLWIVQLNVIFLRLIMLRIRIFIGITFLRATGTWAILVRMFVLYVFDKKLFSLKIFVAVDACENFWVVNIYSMLIHSWEKGAVTTIAGKRLCIGGMVLGHMLFYHNLAVTCISTFKVTNFLFYFVNSMFLSLQGHLIGKLRIT